MNDVIFTGNLSFLNLGELLQILGSNSSNGVLRITSKHVRDQGLIYLVNGNPVNASAGLLSGIDALYSLFGWTEGKFEFSQQHAKIDKVINKNRMEIILCSLRMLDDGLIKKLGPISFDKSDSSDKATELPVIRGPLVDYVYVVDEEGFSDGEEIVNEGKHGNCIRIILGGVVEIIKKTPDGTVKLLGLGEGSFIGSVSPLLMEGSTRSATVVAKGNVQLGVLDLRRLAGDFSLLSSHFRKILLNLDKRLKQVTKIAAGINIKNKSLKELIQNKPVIKQGKSEDKIYFIERGEAYVVRSINNDYVLLANLCKEDCFGNIPFVEIGHEPYFASVFGSKGLKFGAITMDDIQQEYNQLSLTVRNIIDNLASCISATSMLACEFQRKNK